MWGKRKNECQGMQSFLHTLIAVKGTITLCTVHSSFILLSLTPNPLLPCTPTLFLAIARLQTFQLSSPSALRRPSSPHPFRSVTYCSNGSCREQEVDAPIIKIATFFSLRTEDRDTDPRVRSSPSKPPSRDLIMLLLNMSPSQGSSHRCYGSSAVLSFTRVS